MDTTKKVNSVKNIPAKLTDRLSIADNFESAIEEIQLPQDKKKEIIEEKTISSLVKAILKTVGLGGIGEFLSLNEKIQDEFRKKKVEVLIASYAEQTKENEDSIKALKNFVLDPQGNMLFNKILRIINDNSPNPYYINLLATVLRKIISSDFATHFEKHKYSISVIEKLSVQAIIILADSNNWHPFKITKYSSSGGIIQSEWTSLFSETYAKSKKISDKKIVMRINHALQELLRNGLVLARIPGAKDSKDFGSLKEADTNVICNTSDLGREICEYLV